MTGVQTCALPILLGRLREQGEQEHENDQEEQQWLGPESESLLARARTLVAEKILNFLGRLISGEVDLSHIPSLELFLDSSISKFVEFPASFRVSASRNLEVSHTLLLSKLF